MSRAFLLSVSAWLLSLSASAGPRLVLPGATDFDLGLVRAGDSVHREIRLRNEGDEELRIRLTGS